MAGACDITYRSRLSWLLSEVQCNDGLASASFALYCRPGGWLPKGISGVTSVLGYIPFLGGPTSQPQPTEAEMQELYRELDYHPQGVPATAGASSTSLTIKLQACLYVLVSSF